MFEKCYVNLFWSKPISVNILLLKRFTKPYRKRSTVQKHFFGFCTSTAWEKVGWIRHARSDGLTAPKQGWRRKNRTRPHANPDRAWSNFRADFPDYFCRSQKAFRSEHKRRSCRAPAVAQNFVRSASSHQLRRGVLGDFEMVREIWWTIICDPTLYRMQHGCVIWLWLCGRGAG